MLYEITQQIMKHANGLRVTEALAKNEKCAICDKRIVSVAGAYLLERSQRLAHPGACKTNALRMEFVHAHASRTGLRAMRRRIA
jgi:hypothetical protein